jgi:hypothetical protein
MMATFPQHPMLVREGHHHLHRNNHQEPTDTPNPKGPTADLSEIHSAQAQAKIPLSYWFEISHHQANMQQHRW